MPWADPRRRRACSFRYRPAGRDSGSQPTCAAAATDQKPRLAATIPRLSVRAVGVSREPRLLLDASRSHREVVTAPHQLGPGRRRGSGGRLCPDAAVRAMPARLLLCLLLRSSWLTLEGGREVSAAGVLLRRGGRAAVAVSVGVAVGVPFRQRRGGEHGRLEIVGERQPAPLADVRGQAEPASMLRRTGRWLPCTRCRRLVGATRVIALPAERQPAGRGRGLLVVVLSVVSGDGPRTLAYRRRESAGGQRAGVVSGRRIAPGVRVRVDAARCEGFWPRRERD
jgi:hypothetical protein